MIINCDKFGAKLVKIIRKTFLLFHLFYFLLFFGHFLVEKIKNIAQELALFGIKRK